MALSAAAQGSDDGFLRRNGTTYLVRHGQLRPLMREVHLPNGRTVTPEGFVLSADGQRTALAEGQGCDLRGVPVSGRQQSNGAWALGSATAQPRPVPAAYQPYAEQLWRLPPGQRKKLLKHLGKKHGRKHDH
ncbi:DUF6799 domain-containing protein [Hymenobacter sp. CRA2]|uniref:DUF6799 domain-containing protein n=1 Tax=Hymenobacter sp. CRA2 TaxID=1955620 RepID=UPI00098FF61E|nr:DUF6799 domain-containing protein [Hymenobacter sp. CRA2]OON68358.1 hypothetical protein B0919_14520 [Hymenobacter sp. CRA2]